VSCTNIAGGEFVNVILYFFILGEFSSVTAHSMGLQFDGARWQKKATGKEEATKSSRKDITGKWIYLWQKRSDGCQVSCAQCKHERSADDYLDRLNPEP